MLLARVNPNAPGIDEITYECRDCKRKGEGRRGRGRRGGKGGGKGVGRSARHGTLPPSRLMSVFGVADMGLTPRDVRF